MATWLLGCAIMSIYFSSEITVKFSLKFPIKQINTIKELVDSDMPLIVTPSFFGLQSIKDQNLFYTIKQKVEIEKTIVSNIEMYTDEKWIVDASLGRAALFTYEVPLKQMAVIFKKHFKPNTKFRFIDERYGNPFILTIAATTRLPRSFRDMLNLRL